MGFVKSEKFWILTKDKTNHTENLLDTSIFENYINIPGFTFRSEIGSESSFLFTINQENRINRVLWSDKFNAQSILRYFEEVKMS